MLTGFVAHNITQLAQQGITIILSTHDKDLLINMPCTIYLMKHGKIIESGSSEKIFLAPQAYPHINQFISGF